MRRVVGERTLLKVVAIICITVLEMFNLKYFGYDGTVLALVIAIIAGIAGYQIGLFRKGEKGE